MRKGMTFFMDDEMHRRLKVAVAHRGTNMATILNLAVLAYVDETVWGVCR